MEIGGKRRRPHGQQNVKKTQQFRQPRRASQKSVIPGLLKQTGTEKKVLFTGALDPINPLLALNSTGSILAINLVQVGSSMFNRIGRRIEMKSIRLVGYLSTIVATRATNYGEIGRIMVVYDRQTNGAYPAMQDILQDTDQQANNTTESMSGINMNNRERFVTIIDQKITIPQGTSTAGVLTNVFPNDSMLPSKVDHFRRLRGLTTHYKADSNPAVIGDISTGGLYIVTLAQTGAGGELFNFGWNCRLKYVDV